MSNSYKKGGTATLIKIAYRNIWRNMRRTVFSFTAIGITTFIFVVAIGLNDGLIKTTNDTMQVYEEGHVKVVSAQYEAEKEYMPVQYPVADGKNWKELAASISEISGVRRVLPRIVTMATLQENTIKHAVLWGLDIPKEMEANHFNLADRNDGLKEGRWPAPDTNECAIGSVFAEKSRLRIGDNIPLRTTSAQFSDKIWSPAITGIFNFDFYKYDEQYIIVDFRRLQRLLVLEEGTQSLIIFADDERRSGFIAASVQDLLGQDNVVTDWNESYWVALARLDAPIYTIAYLVVLVLASFLLLNTIVMIIHERTKEIGMMGSLGMTRFEIVKVFFFESLFISAIAATAGVFLGGILTGILTQFPIRLGNFPSMSNTMFFKFSIVRIVQAWFIGVAITSLCTLFPTMKSAFVEPVEALRG